VELYRRKTQKIVSQFLAGEFTLDECTAALDKALDNLARRGIGQQDAVALRILCSMNNGIVTREVERRKSSKSQQMELSKAPQRCSLPSDVSRKSEAAT